MAERNAKVQNQLQQVKLSSKQQNLVNLSKENFIKELRDLHVNGFQEITFHDRLGEGSFGSCFSGLYQGEKVAIKVMRHGLVTKAGLKAFKREVHMLYTASHDNIVAFRGFSMTSQLVILMEFMDSGSILDMIVNRPEVEDAFKISIFIDLMKGLRYLKSRQIIHRDIKSENILLKIRSQGEQDQMSSRDLKKSARNFSSSALPRRGSVTNPLVAKLADLGESRFTDAGQTMTMTGRSPSSGARADPNRQSGLSD